MTIVRQGGPITAAELLAVLRDLPPDMPVLVEGYEGGLDDVEIERAEVAFGCCEGGLLGRHNRVEDLWCRQEAYGDRREALILFGWQPDERAAGEAGQ